MIISVDFDGTLALGSKSHITLSEPNYELINRLRRAKNEFGCTIKIVTARGSKSNLSNREKINRYDKHIRQFLNQYNVPFDEISYNKEYAHIYIDDMSISPFDDFEPLLSPFTKSKILFTKDTVIKNSNTALFEFEWYKKSIVKIPNVLFCNDELIITQRIKNLTTPSIDDYFYLLDAFRNASIKNWSFDTYVQNIQAIQYQSEKTLSIVEGIQEHKQSFFHGDFSTTNILKSDDLYLIDPNYKNIFGSYLTDAGKLYFSLIAYNNDYKTAKLIADKYGEDVIKFAVCEGLRVCKYQPKYISIVNNISDLVD
jgi:hypothetical protein